MGKGRAREGKGAGKGVQRGRGKWKGKGRGRRGGRLGWAWQGRRWGREIRVVSETSLVLV